MFGNNLVLLKWKEERVYKRLNYSLRDMILFDEVASFGACQYIGGIWKAWVVLREVATI